MNEVVTDDKFLVQVLLAKVDTKAFPIVFQDEGESRTLNWDTDVVKRDAPNEHVILHGVVFHRNRAHGGLVLCAMGQGGLVEKPGVLLGVVGDDIERTVWAVGMFVRAAIRNIFVARIVS